MTVVFSPWSMNTFFFDLSCFHAERESWERIKPELLEILKAHRMYNARVTIRSELISSPVDDQCLFQL
jgi:hypothetical protein